MLGRVKSILLFALVLLASGQSAFAAFKHGSSDQLFPTGEAACLDRATSANPTYQFRNVSFAPLGSLQGRYRCTYEYSKPSSPDRWLSDNSYTITEVSQCTVGEVQSFKGAISSVIFTEKEQKYFVLGSAPASGCYSSCTYESKVSKTDSCYLLKGSTTQGYCNYSLVNSGQSCSANTLSPADLSGDSLTPPVTDPGTGTPDPGTGTPGTDPGTGTPGTDPGTGTPGTDPGTSTPGTDPGTGTPGTDPGTGTPGTDPGTGTPGTDPGTGNPGTGPGTGTGSGEGDKYGAVGSAEYSRAQDLNAANSGISKGVDQAQDALGDAANKALNDAGKEAKDAERSVSDRFKSFLPSSSACVNPQLRLLSWLSITVDICRYIFVKTLLSWVFSVSTLFYVFRVLTSLGSTTSEV